MPGDRAGLRGVRPKDSINGTGPLASGYRKFFEGERVSESQERAVGRRVCLTVDIEVANHPHPCVGYPARPLRNASGFKEW